jgi:hypothetical protein
MSGPEADKVNFIDSGHSIGQFGSGGFTERSGTT